MQPNFLLMLTYDAESGSSAIDQARPGLTKLENEFPDVYFDTWFIHINDVRDGDLRQSEQVF